MFSPHPLLSGDVSPLLPSVHRSINTHDCKAHRGCTPHLRAQQTAVHRPDPAPGLFWPIKFYWWTVMSISLAVICDCFGVTRAELTSWERDRVGCKTQNSFCLALCRKCLPSPILLCLCGRVCARAKIYVTENLLSEPYLDTQLSSIKHTHAVVQPSPPSVSRTFHFPKLRLSP